MIRRTITLVWHEDSDPEAIDARIAEFIQGAKANWLPYGLMDVEIENDDAET